MPAWYLVAVAFKKEKAYQTIDQEKLQRDNERCSAEFIHKLLHIYQVW